MPKMYIKVKDGKTKKEYFMGWSTIIDEPNTYIWNEKTFKENVQLNDIESLSLRYNDCSNPHYNVAELISMSPEFDTQKELLKYCIENVQDNTNVIETQVLNVDNKEMLYNLRNFLNDEITKINNTILKNDNGLLDTEDNVQAISFSRGRVVGLITSRDKINKLLLN